MTDLLKKTKVTELEKKIPDVSNLATTNAVTAVKNKIPSTSSLVKKKKQIMAKKLVSLKKSLLITIMINMLLFRSLIL